MRLASWFKNTISEKINKYWPGFVIGGKRSVLVEKAGPFAWKNKGTLQAA
jgi:hypothetical protein